MGKEPHRRLVMRAKIEADSWSDLYGHLKSLVTQMACNDHRLSKQSISGGYSTGHIIVIEEDEDMTHDKWAADLDAWLEAERASKISGERSDAA
jgi:hypothetical protein